MRKAALVSLGALLAASAPSVPADVDVAVPYRVLKETVETMQKALLEQEASNTAALEAGLRS